MWQFLRHHLGRRLHYHLGGPFSGPKDRSMPVNDDQELRQILDNARIVAVVGLSDRPDRPSYGVAEFLFERGYLIIPVNPNITEFRGVAAVASLADIEEPIDIVDVFRRPEFTPEIARAAVAAGAGALWLQQGIVNDEAMEIAEAGGLNTVQDRCIAVTYRMLGLT